MSNFLELASKFIKICIIGGGNVGVATAVDLSQNNKLSIVLISSKADKLFDKELSFIDSYSNKILKGNNIKVTADYSELKNADLVIVTIPSFCIPDLKKKMNQYTPKIILFIPGFGGKEFIFQDFIKKGCLLCGFDRSLYIARLKNENEVVASKKRNIRLGCMDNSKTEQLCMFANEIFNINVVPLKNYLTVTFTPSNPILHTARLYSIFKEYNFNSCFESNISFYADWTNFASELLFKMDNELLLICDALKGIDMSGVIPNSVHYESNTIDELTNKIRSIKTWNNITAPMKKSNNSYYIDSESRYFKEDFPYGLCNLIGFAKLLKVDTPIMDEVLKWYQTISGIEYFDKNGCFCGSGLKKSCIPQNFGINTLEEIKNFYKL